MGWLRAIAATTGRPVTFNLNQPDYDPDLWRHDLELLEQAAEDGLDVLAQVAGRPVGILECWGATVHPFVGCSSWQAIADLPLGDRAGGAP